MSGWRRGIPTTYYRAVTELVPPALADSGSYEIVTHLATGGMAELFIARARTGGRHVVLKQIRGEHAGQDQLISLFLDEARLSSRLRHPNIAQVLEVGRARHGYFYTMEYVHGRNLREVLQRLVAVERQLPIEAALAVLIGAAAGLHAAHEQRDHLGQPLGIVHRDVTPSNVMIGFDGAVKIVDFGVATAADHITEIDASVVKGKSAYLSPEQCARRTLDRRSDIFALGIVGYELVTRRRLFRRDSSYATMRAILDDPAPSPSAIRRSLPAGLDAILARMLAKDPDDRFATAGDVRDALIALATELDLRTDGALAPAMRTLFGDCPEPWRVGTERASAIGSPRVSPAASMEPTPPAFDARAPGRWPAATEPPWLGESRGTPRPDDLRSVAVVAEAMPKPAVAATIPAAATAANGAPGAPAIAPRFRRGIAFLVGVAIGGAVVAAALSLAGW